MLGKKVIVDSNCEIARLLEPMADQVIDNILQAEFDRPTIMIFSRAQHVAYPWVVGNWMQNPMVTPVLCNTVEGSETISWHIEKLGLSEYILSGRMLMITGGDLPSNYPNIKFPELLCQTAVINPLSVTEKIMPGIFDKAVKPYKFLFLNGRTRRNRKYLLERFQQWGLLEQSLWTCLEGWGYYDDIVRVPDSEENLMLRSRTIQYLPPQYELPAVRDRQSLPLPTDTPFVKFHLFDGVWRDAEIWPAPYIDTYFSLVTETVFEYPHSFLTEKIAKPMAVGHPFIVSSNVNFYRDLRQQGFRTFGHLIDESFDSMDSCQDRIERIAQVTRDLCGQNLHSFLLAAADVCKYNQHRLYEFVEQQQQIFLNNFHHFLRRHLA